MAKTSSQTADASTCWSQQQTPSKTAKISSTYGVSYSQVYSWVQKYERDGYEALVDHRGHRIQDRTVAKLSKEEQLARQLKKLEARNQDLAAENYFLKKLSALENESEQ